jgi:polygalacturonase
VTAVESALMSERFGAVGDRVADDTAAFEAAIAVMAGVGGKHGPVPTRDYKIARVALNVPDLTIRSDGGRVIDGAFDIGEYGELHTRGRISHFAIWRS